MRPVRVAAQPATQQSADPYVLLAAAVLKQALMDAQGRGGHAWRPEYQAEALRFLRSTAALDEWVGLCGGDTEHVQSLLLAQVPQAS
jgi:hypothetical protein